MKNQSNGVTSKVSNKALRVELIKGLIPEEKANALESMLKQNSIEEEEYMYEFELHKPIMDGIETAGKYLSEDFGTIKLTSDGEDALYLTISKMTDHLFIEDKVKASIATLQLLKALQKVALNGLNLDFPENTECHIHKIGMIEQIMIKLRNLTQEKTNFNIAASLSL